MTNEVLWLLGFPLGFFASAYFSGIGAFLTELYPTRLRGSGQGFCYNFGRGIGALFPFLVGALSKQTSLGNAIAVFAVLAYGLFFIAAFALPETRGKILHADALKTDVASCMMAVFYLPTVYGPPRSSARA